MKCRFCQHQLTHEFVDLVNSPPSNSFLTAEQLNKPETFLPLKLYLCEKCWLVQIDEYKKANEIFDCSYAYFSSFSQSWLEHSKNYAEMIARQLGLNESSLVIEIASNDGYLLQYFKQKNIPCLGIEPAENTAMAAKEKGIETICEFFGRKLAKKLVSENKASDLVIGNNVLAHVPDLNDFVEGIKKLLKPRGVATMEFPHLMKLVEYNQFDTIYHEHFSYISFNTAKIIFEAHGLELFDVEELATHGGSLRIYAKNKKDTSKAVSERVRKLEQKEIECGMLTVDFYKQFQEKIDKVKYDLLSFLIEQKQRKKIVAAYGAAAKGNTLLNYCGIKKDLILFVADASPYKQDKFLPGVHIPVTDEGRIRKTRPDFVLVLPWNLREEISNQLAYIRNWGGRFVVPVPKIEVF